MIASPWAGALRWSDYAALAQLFGFRDAQECRDYAEDQQDKADQRAGEQR